MSRWRRWSEEGLRVPLLRSPRLGRGDWLLTLAVVSWALALAVVVAAWAFGRDVPEGARSLAHTILGGTLLSYVAKSLPERRVSASSGADGAVKVEADAK